MGPPTTANAASAPVNVKDRTRSSRLTSANSRRRSSSSSANTGTDNHRLLTSESPGQEPTEPISAGISR